MTALYHLFPPTIHPMVVHFTIAIVYLAAVAGIAGVVYRRTSYFATTFLLLLLLAGVATVAAGVAGVVSEYYLHNVPHVVRPMLASHRTYGEATGVLLGIAFAFQVWNWWNKRAETRVSWPALMFSLVAVVTVSLAGHLGGTMVYHYGLGVQ